MSRIQRLHNLLVTKQISAKELTQIYLDAILSDNPSLNAYVCVTADEALAAAELADKKLMNGEKIGILEGIPMTLKDNISTQGIATTCCSKILEGYIPPFNATVWDKLKAQGAVLLGKTNMDEFAMGCTSETSVYGACKNPHNIDFVTGGSSGGGAAAVSGNLAAFALGSDTGGSVRQPASFCGCVGLKPTYGAVSRYGLVAYASSLDQIGVLAPDAVDAAIVFDAISGKDCRDCTSRCVDFCTIDSLDNDISGKTIGVPRELIERSSPDVRDALYSALQVFEALGAETEFFSMSVLDAALYTYFVISCAEASSNLGRYDGVRYGKRAENYENAHQLMVNTRSEFFGNEVKRRIMLGNFVLSPSDDEDYYKKALLIRREMKARFKRAFEKYDVIITPTSPSTAFELNEKAGNKTDSATSDMCTASVNLAGLCAVSVPCGKDRLGLPIGLHIIGNCFKEAEILNFAYKYQQAASHSMITKWGVKL